MKGNIDKALGHVLASEGSFVNNPADPGGMTNLGVTKKAWDAYTGRNTTEAEMRALTPGMVASFYKINYWNKCWCDRLPTGTDYLVFDFAVNAGPYRAVKTLQEATGATPDGIMGNQTLKAATEATNLPGKYSTAKEAFYRSLPTFPTFGKGWLNRIAEVEKNAATFG